MGIMGILMEVSIDILWENHGKQWRIIWEYIGNPHEMGDIWGFLKWGYPEENGWFLLGKMPSRNG